MFRITLYQRIQSKGSDSIQDKILGDLVLHAIPDIGHHIQYKGLTYLIERVLWYEDGDVHLQARED